MNTRNKKDTKYFTGTPDQASTIARYQLYTLNEARAGRSDIEILQTTCGDTAVRTLYETENHLVFITLDSCIEVIIVIDKLDFAKSESIEL